MVTLGDPDVAEMIARWLKGFVVALPLPEIDPHAAAYSCYYKFARRKLLWRLR